MSKIIRSRRDTPFVQIDKTGPEDKNLSWKAKGILAYILCKPDDWQIYISELSNNSKDGKDSTRAGVNELIANGYIVRNRVHDENGKFAGYDYQVHEKPVTIFAKTVNGKAVVGKPVYGKTVYGKSNATNNNLNNKDLNNNKNSESSRKKITTEDIEDFELLENLESLPVDELPKKVAPKKGFENEESPNWMEVALAAIEYVTKDPEGIDQWNFMCKGRRVEPDDIMTAYFGKYADSPFILRNWKKEIPKMTNWINTQLQSQKKQKAYEKTSTKARLTVEEYEKPRQIKVSKVPSL